ncbi:MAG: O-antigen ligase family protein [Phycisphaerae bacterium]|jgi:hypothetical protein
MSVPRDPLSLPGATGFAHRAGRLLQDLALPALLAVLVARLFISELPYRWSLISVGDGSLAGAGGDRDELARVSFAMILLGIWAAWLAGSALRGGIVLRHRLAAGLGAAFVILSLLSVFVAADARSAWDVWLEQTSLIASFLLAAEVFAARRNLLWLVVVLAAAGACIACKELWQVLGEIPDRVADFEAHRAQRLATMGFSPGSSEAGAFEARLRATTATGFFTLSNLAGSVMLVTAMAALGLAIDKTAGAIRSWRDSRAALKRGELHTPLLAAALTIFAAALAVTGLVLTRSRGALAVAVLAGLGLPVLLRWRRPLAAHWRKATLVAACVLALMLAGAVAFGLRYDRLPSKSMTFRWYYWTGSAEIIREHPLLGVGPGNFPAAYLQHRRAAAEESVKLPHNIIMHALTQFGLPGGLCYLAVVVVGLVGMCRPGRRIDSPPDRVGRPSSRRVAAMVLTLCLSAAMARSVFANALVSPFPYVFILEAALPACLLAALLVAAVWSGQALWRGLELAPLASRIALAVGAGAFFLHSMIEFGPWSPGVALVFWIACGACQGTGIPEDRKTGAPEGLNGWVICRLRWVMVGAVAVGLVAAGVFLWRPVFSRTVSSELAMMFSDKNKATLMAVRAAEDDPLDAFSAADAAIAIVSLTNEEPGNGLFSPADALAWAKIAMRRDPSSYAHARLAAQIAQRLGGPAAGEALALLADAVRLNPMDARLRMDYARLLLQAGHGEQARAQLAEAERIDRALNPESLVRLNGDERAQLQSLLRQAGANRPVDAPKQDD